MSNGISKLQEDLLFAGNDIEWSEFLFTIQNSLIYYGYLQNRSLKDTEDFALKFQTLHGIITDLIKKKKGPNKTTRA